MWASRASFENCLLSFVDHHLLRNCSRYSGALGKTCFCHRLKTRQPTPMSLGPCLMMRLDYFYTFLFLSCIFGAPGAGALGGRLVRLTVGPALHLLEKILLAAKLTGLNYKLQQKNEHYRTTTIISQNIKYISLSSAFKMKQSIVKTQEGRLKVNRLSKRVILHYTCLATNLVMK